MAKEKSTAMKAAILFDKVQKLKLDCEIKCDALEEAAGAETRDAYQSLVESLQSQVERTEVGDV